MGKRGPNAKPVEIPKRTTRRKGLLSTPSLNRIDRNIDWIEGLPVTSGILAGTQLKLRPFQLKIIEGIYRVDSDGSRYVRQAVLSMPRKNGKTGLVAPIGLLHFCGPEAVDRGQVYSAAAERQQSGLMYAEMKAIIERVPELNKRIIVRDFTKQLEDAITGSVFFALSAEATTKHGYSPNCWIYDELAQAANRKLYDVLQTSTGAHKEPLSVVISTQSHDPNHIMSELVDYGLRVNAGEIEDKAFYAAIYSAPEDADPWDERTWFDCNPALGDFRSLEEMRSSALQAQRMPAREPSFRLLYLNQRIQAEASLISKPEWTRCKSSTVPLIKPGEEIFLGLDLSATIDLTALVACSANGGENLKSWFWKPGDEIAEHVRRDKVPYDLWVKEGWIEAPKGRAVEYGFVARRIAEICQDYRVLGLAYDRWGMKNLKKELDAIGLKYYEDGKEKPVPGQLRLIPWAQSYSDMSPAVNALEMSVLSDKLRHDGNPVLTFCVANAVVEMDAAGNRKLDKSATRYRIDGAVAAAMAIGLKAKQPAKKEASYQFFAV